MAPESHFAPEGSKIRAPYHAPRNGPALELQTDPHRRDVWRQGGCFDGIQGVSGRGKNLVTPSVKGLHRSPGQVAIDRASATSRGVPEQIQGPRRSIQRWEGPGGEGPRVQPEAAQISLTPDARIAGPTCRVVPGWASRWPVSGRAQAGQNFAPVGSGAPQAEQWM
jgi:hypothetical protein